MNTDLNNQHRQDTRLDTTQAASNAGETAFPKAHTPPGTQHGNIPERSAVVANRESTERQPAGVEEEKGRKRIDPIAAAEAKLKQKEAKLAESRNLLQQRKRKMRNGQLYVWGAMVESAYRHGDAEQRKLLRRLAETYLSDERHRERSGYGFTRVDCEREENKT